MTYDQQAKIFQAMAHPVRLQILAKLALKPLCVCELIQATGRRQAYISQHLLLLRRVGLVHYNRQGLNVYYSLNQECLQETAAHLQILLTKPPSKLSLANSFSGATPMTSVRNQLNEWHDIPRHEIVWYPTIVTDRCIGCGVCVTSCGRGVYAYDYEAKQPVVVEPLKCMVGCTTCATICLYDAIEFPSTGWIRQLIRDKKVLRQSKNLLKQYPEKYDVRLRKHQEIQ